MDRATQDARAKEFLDEVADTLTQRAKSYPAYSVEAAKVCLVWNALKDSQLTPQDVALFMVIVKLVRLEAGNSPDSLVDAVGYLARLEGMGQ